jgi:hypothetical protein
MTFEDLSVALLFVAIAAAACVMPAQNDTWWHLRAGQEIWRTHGVPLLDTFSHTAYGAYWPDHEWLSQALFFALYRVGGLTLLTAVLATVVTLTWILVWRLTPGSHWARVLLVSLAVIPSSIAWSIRPQVFTLLFIVLTLVLLSHKREWWLPVLFLIWANLHGAVLLGLVTLAAVTVGAVLTDRRAARALLGVTMLCAVMTCITPLGLSFWTRIPASLARVDHNRVTEWHAPQLSDPQFAPFWILTAVLIGLLAAHPGRIRQWLRNGAVAGALAMLPLAMTTARNVPVLMVVIVPAIASLVDPRVRVRTAARIRAERVHLNLAMAGGALAAAVLFVAFAWTHEIERLGWHPLPRQIAAAVASCPERLYNRYDEGGFVIWFAPAQRVFLDSRYDPYPAALVLEQLDLEASGDFHATFAKYGIRCAFVPSESPVARALAKAGWQTMAHEAAWSVLTAPVDPPRLRVEGDRAGTSFTRKKSG